MAFPPEFLDELRRRLVLSSVIARQVKLQRKGKEHLGLCPFHKEKTPSFTVSDDKGFYHCFGCGAHGDVIGFVMNVQGLSFPEAVDNLAGEAGLEVPRQEPSDAAAREKRKGLTDVLESAARWFEARLASPEGAAARDYLTARGLSRETVETFRLGYAPPDRGKLRAALEREGFDPSLLVEAGLVKRPEDGGPGETRDFFFNRVIFPITDRRARVIAFGGRTLGESRAKYINSPETPVFQKGRVLYNLSTALRAARDQGELILAEGYMDVLALAQSGFTAAVAPLGTAVTEGQIEELWRIVPEPILCLDGDAAGRRAAVRAAERALPILKPGLSLQFAFLPQGEDPDSLLQAEGPQAMRARLEAALPLVDLLWIKETEGRDLSTPERRAALRRDLRQTTQALQDRELAEDFLDELMARFEAAFPRRGRFGGRREDAPWQPRTSRTGPAERPVSGGQLSRPDPQGRRDRRREQLLLMLLVAHPPLIEENWEEIASLELRASNLRRFLTCLMDGFLALTADSESGKHSSGRMLDTEDLRCHLRDKGFAGVLEDLFSPDVMVHGKFARPDASLEAARGGFTHLLREIRHDKMRSEADEAGRALAQDMTEESLLRLRARLEVLGAATMQEDSESAPSLPQGEGRKG